MIQQFKEKLIMLADHHHLRVQTSFTEPQLSPRAPDDFSSTTSESNQKPQNNRSKGFTYFKPPQEEEVQSNLHPQYFFDYAPQGVWPQEEAWSDLRSSMAFRSSVPHPSEPMFTHFMPPKDFVTHLEQDIRRQFVEFLPNLLKNLEKFSQNTRVPCNEASQELEKPIVHVEIPKKEERAPLCALLNLNNYLVNILKGNMVTEEDINLSWIEKAILASIINKKFTHKKLKRVERISDLTREFLSEFPENVSKLSSLKRTEENYKITFNWCFKFLKKKLAEKLASEGHKPLCKRDLESYFYNYYFKEIADAKGIELIKFAKPNFTNKVQNGEKTFNSNFISNIQLSPHFMSDFFQALDFFVPTHMDLISRKLSSLLMKWEEELNQCPETEEVVRKISNYIMKSSKCKLPWSVREIEAAHRTVLSLFK